MGSILIQITTTRHVPQTPFTPSSQGYKQTPPANNSNSLMLHPETESPYVESSQTVKSLKALLSQWSIAVVWWVPSGQMIKPYPLV